MNPDRIREYIDSNFLIRINNCDSLVDVILHFNLVLNRFRIRDNYIDITEDELIKEWNNYNIKVRYTTMYVLHSEKRMKDIGWIIKNKENLPQLSNEKLFKLVVLKDKLMIK